MRIPVQLTGGLVIDRVSAGYGETTILRDVSLQVPPESTVAILGPNGAGKTTLLRAISGLITPSSGRILFNGTDMTQLSPSDRVKQGVCLIPDPRGIFPSLTVKENLILQAPRGSVRSTVIDQAVEAFPRLGQRIGQRAGTLSGGEQQMLAIARAYVQRPSLVLLDEVSMGLAPNLVDEIFEFLEGLSSRGVALVLIEQFVHRALEIADEVFILCKGQVVRSGPSKDMTVDDVFAAYTGTSVPVG
jgi:branched-chain amino acid transport system ATP-binding protein